MKTLVKTISTALITSSMLPLAAIAGEGDWLVRARAIDVVSNESSTISVINGAVDVSDVVTPELDFTYFVTDNVGVELILATTRHDAIALGTDLGDVELGKVSLLPPTLLLQYHFTDLGDIKPYVGAGVNLTFFYNAEAPGTIVTDINYKTAVGIALQAGVDIPVSENFFFNIDVKKIFLNTDAAINGGAINADITLNPWVFGIGFGKSF